MFWNIRIGRVSFVKELERWEDSLENRRRGRGLWAKLPLSSPPLSLPAEQGRRLARRRRPWAGGLGARRRSGSGRKGIGRHGELIPGRSSSGVARGSLATAAGGSDRGGGAARLDGGPELGKKGDGTSWVLLRPLPWTVVAQGGGSAVAGGARRLWWAVAALGARGGARGGESGGGGRELREGPTYRPGEAVERAGQVTGW